MGQQVLISRVQDGEELDPEALGTAASSRVWELASNSRSAVACVKSVPAGSVQAGQHNVEVVGVQETRC